MKAKHLIKNPRQRRALEALLEHPKGIPCKDLGPMIGALNPQQTIMELRRQVFHDSIITEFFEIYDRDGQICRPGQYRTPKEYREWVQFALNEKATPTDTAEGMAPETKSKNHDNAGGQA